MSRFLTRLGATFLFTGAFPVAPATFCSLIVAIAWAALPAAPWWLALLLIAAVVAVGIPLSTRAEEIYGHDGKPIVIDEVAGMLITVFALGDVAVEHRWGVAAAGFLLFRILDVVKPPPAYQLQSLRGGWGIMADDVMAGIYANLLLRLFVLWRGAAS